MWQEAKWAEMRWALPTSSISSWVSHLPPASQQSRLVWAWAHICSWIPYGTGPLSQPRGQDTDDINSYFCLSPAVSILQHEWEAWPQFLICPRLVSPQGCHACHSPPPGISVTLLLSWRGEKAERGKNCHRRSQNKPRFSHLRSAVALQPLFTLVLVQKFW